MISYLYENKKGFELRGNIIHEASVLSEPLNITFISHVYENWSIDFITTPKSVIDQIPLLECLVTLRIVIEVIEILREVFCFVKLVIAR